MLLANLELRARLAEVDASIAELKLRLKVLEDIRLLNQRRLDGVVYPFHLKLPPRSSSNVFLVSSSGSRSQQNNQRGPKVFGCSSASAPDLPDVEEYRIYDSSAMGLSAPEPCRSSQRGGGT
ncbi:hypothetical protein B0H14DRAFT_2595143 [Mycena olivaceomarginata]|nr:hypothetical protein B0H14DRAFT_2595143 [Mycena olivaceomarginata]